MEWKRYLTDIGKILSGLIMVSTSLEGGENLGVSPNSKVDTFTAKQFRPPSTIIIEPIYYAGKKLPVPEHTSHSDDSLVAIINGLDTTDYEKLVSDLMWYSGRRFDFEWDIQLNLLKSKYLNYLDQVLETSCDKQWLGFKDDVSYIYIRLSELSENNVEKTKMLIKAATVYTNAKDTGTAGDYYSLGKIFQRVSLYHPEKESRNGCATESIYYFRQARTVPSIEYSGQK